MTSILKKPHQKNAENQRITEALSHEVPINSGWKSDNKICIKTEVPSRIFVDSGMLCIENMAKLPLNRCIKTNTPTDIIVQIQLRHPLKPITWWGKQPRRLTVGLSVTAWRRSRFYSRISWSLAGLAALSFCCLLLSPIFIIVSALLFILASILRSNSPIRGKHTSREFTAVRGVCREFGQQFEQYQKGEPLN